MEYKPKRVTVFSGHYGSGKTNIAVNYALSLKNLGKNTAIYDLDIVNPYFRTVDAQSELRKAGVELVVSPYAATNVDIPAMNASAYKIIDDRNSFAVIDLGGDDRGALALGRFSDKIKEENNYDMFLVANMCRPETKDLNGLKTIKDEIEFCGRIKFTGIINNTNLGVDTQIEDVIKGARLLREFSGKENIPIAFTCVNASLKEKAEEIFERVLPIDLIKYGEW